jgi:hypothetical protein
MIDLDIVVEHSQPPLPRVPTGAVIAAVIAAWAARKTAGHLPSRRRRLQQLADLVKGLPEWPGQEQVQRLLDRNLMRYPAGGEQEFVDPIYCWSGNVSVPFAILMIPGSTLFTLTPTVRAGLPFRTGAWPEVQKQLEAAFLENADGGLAKWLALWRTAVSEWRPTMTPAEVVVRRSASAVPAVAVGGGRRDSADPPPS